MDSYEKVLEGILNEVSFGYETIRVYQEPGLQSPSNWIFNRPDWRASDWRTGKRLANGVDCLIGYEECSGDPIFIDSLTERFPVYTAIHGLKAATGGKTNCRLIGCIWPRPCPL